MELTLHPIATKCFVSGREFVENDRVVSYLVREPTGEVARRDLLESEDPLKALQDLAKAWLGELREEGAKVVGVTGSTGKTSTKDILAALLAGNRRTVSSPENRNTEIGMPMAILGAPKGTEVLVLEMAMRGKGQIAQLAEIAQEPDVGVIVNVGPVHLEQMGSIEGVAQAKAYAEKLQARFAFATNGRKIYRIDMKTGAEAYVAGYPTPDELWADTFHEAKLDARWTWLRPPADDAWSLGPQGLTLATAATDLHADTNTASVLQAPLPDGDYRIEAVVKLDVPDACCATAVQAGFVVMRDDDNYVKLVEMAHGGLHQVEFAKEMAPGPADYPRYGNTVVGTPGATTWLRLDVHRAGGEERYTAYSSRDGLVWVGGGTWTHRLGREARLGLVAMGGAGQRAVVERVAVSRLSR